MHINYVYYTVDEKSHFCHKLNAICFYTYIETIISVYFEKGFSANFNHNNFQQMEFSLNELNQTCNLNVGMMVIALHRYAVNCIYLNFENAIKSTNSPS